MKGLFQKAFVQRLLGATLAGFTVYATSHDWKAAVSTVVSFAVYGAAHTTADAATSDSPAPVA